ncbi:hypothetical protein AZI86_11020 [Bdellovibrio bacteriovorus]|uniref:Formyl transferase N-terminal domain-containing protein n=1 Tax=Bdellovibrio bacteriovorus TaxID=959 RepID=A0A150WLG6_BDEBC|nr:formyltransferase family protein [Bdellovibrio bacteriovorus]KYG64732.1 hypothetical protein AZI86_11020 [Bdellovibrio bacteriovorus]
MGNFKKKVVLIGNGMLPSLCAKHLIERPDVDLSFIVVDDSPQRYGTGLENAAEKFNIPFKKVQKIRGSEIERRVQELRPNFLLSICNSQILRPELLSACEVAINFHNSLLPTYAGSNSCTWAIFKGEKNFGVTFHLIEGEVDSGAIILQKSYPIPDNATAGHLLLTGAHRGFELFKEGIDLVLNNIMPPRHQQLTERTYFTAKERPNDGWFNFHWSTSECLRFLRAFDYGPLQSPVGLPRIKIKDKILYVSTGRESKSPVPNIPEGSIHLIDDGITVRVKDGLIELTSFFTEDMRKLSLSEVIAEYKIQDKMILSN